MAFSSLKVSVGLTASALTMASRVRSWISRSKSGTCGGSTTASRSFLAVALATVPPCNDESEEQMQPAEAGAEERVADGERQEAGCDAEEHEGHAHDGDHADGERAAADERRAVEKQPDRRQGPDQPRPRQDQRQRRPRDQRRRVADEEPPRRRRAERRPRRPPLP